tara:strand:- start:19034 stop:19255 length:222 start_codon:yes stop_codon:yes gene_type:complete
MKAANTIQERAVTSLSAYAEILISLNGEVTHSQLVKQCSTMMEEVKPSEVGEISLDFAKALFIVENNFEISVW